MYKVYINHFRRNNAIVDTEELMFAVPSSTGFPVQKPVVKGSEDNADNFSFSMDSNSSYYDAIIPLKTMIRVVYDGDIIFFGRALAPSTSSIYHTKNVICEGKLGFLKDTYYEGKKEEARAKITVANYLSRIISNHNTMDSSKPFTLGTVGVTLPSALDKYEPSSWSQTLSLIEGLSSNYGGHFRAKYTSGTTTYLDWYKYYVRDLGDGLRPKVTVGKNILDISSDTNIDSIFTRVIPIGDNDSHGNPIYIDRYKYNSTNSYSGKAMPVSFIRNVYSDYALTDEFHDWKDYRDAESNYGIIYKTQSFPNADTQAKLWNQVTKWIKDSYFGMATSFTVKAIDLHIQDSTAPKILLGECVDVTYLIVKNGVSTWETRKLVCKAVQYDLFNPENNSYTFSIPSDLLEIRNNKKSSKKKTISDQTAPPRSTGGGGGGRKPIKFDNIYRMIYAMDDDNTYQGPAAAESFKANGEKSGTYVVYDPYEVYDNEGHMIGDNPRDHLDLCFNAQLVGVITLPGKAPKWVGVSESRGIFAFMDNSRPCPITHWYTKGKTEHYESSEPGISTFEEIARLIENDIDTQYGGTTSATQFRANGRLKGTVKAYDEENTTDPAHHPEFVFNAEIVGKFGFAGEIKYVAISSEFGIFAYTHMSFPDKVKHWYTRAKGLKYDNTDPLISDESGNAYLTDDGSPDGKKEVWLRTFDYEDVTTGQILVGYDTTGSGNNWRVKINVPVQYTDQDGNTTTAYGFVSASDFNLPEIPSFKTKFGVFDQVVAGKIDAASINADIAYIRKISGDSISVGTSVRAANIRANHFSGSSYEITYNDSSSESGYGSAFLQNCFSNCLVYAGNGSGGDNNELGKIYFQFNKIGGGIAQVVNFNIADTQTYKDAVSAATTTGRQEGRNSVVLADPVWDTSGNNVGFNNHVAISTNGRGTNNELSKNIYLYLDDSVGSWSSSHKKNIYLRYSTINATDAQENGVYVGKILVDASSQIPTVTLTGPTWDTSGSNVGVSNHAAVSTSGLSTNLTKNIYLHMTQGSWSSNKKMVYVRYGTSATAAESGTYVAKVQVDANSLIPTVTLTGPTWDTSGSNVGVSNHVAVSTSGLSTNLTKNIYLHMTQGSWSSGKIMVYVRYGTSASAAQSGTYVAKAQVAASDTNLTAANIKKGVSILGITGTYSGSVSGFDTTAPANLVYPGNTDIKNDSNGFQVQNNDTTRNAIVRVVVQGTWYSESERMTGISYLQGVPTKIYQKGWDNMRNKLSQYNSSKMQLYYKSGTSYYPAGQGSYYWYFSNGDY